MSMIDVQKLARKADPFGGDGRLFYVAMNTPKTLERFAALVLEEVANKFDQPHMEYFGQEIQDYIRSLKPKGD